MSDPGSEAAVYVLVVLALALALWLLLSWSGAFA